MGFFDELKRRNVIRVGIAYVLLGWVVLQAADFALDLIDAPNWIIQVFFIAGLAGLPIALFFAWAFEITPEGIKREADVDRSSSLTPTTGRKLDRAILVFLAVAVVLLLGDRFLVERSGIEQLPTDTASLAEPAPPEDLQKSIAVLPFVNMSPDPDQVFFSDGISEEVLNSLAKVDALKVAGRTSSFAFRDRDDDLRTIGATLGVEHILEGSVRKAGDRVRITAQLVKAEDGFHLWSETYDRELNDIFAIQDDIANRILEALKTALEVESNRLSSLDVATYDKYLLGRQLMRERREDPLQRAVRLFDDVNRQAPEFADAWALHGVSYFLLADDQDSYGSIPLLDAQAEARERIERALDLDAENPFALAAMGLLYSDSNLPEAIRYLERALAENPGMSDASNWLWRAYQRTGRFRDARRIITKLIETDPLYLPGVRNLRWTLLTLNDVEATAAHLESLRAQARSFDERTLVGAEQALAQLENRFADAIALYDEERFRGTLIALNTSIMLRELGAYDDARKVSSGLPLEIVALGRLGQREAGEQLARGMLTTGQGVGQYIELLVSTGQYAKAVTFFDERWPSLDAFEAANPQFTLLLGLRVAQLTEALAATGDRERSAAFLDRYRAILAQAESQGAGGRVFLFNKAYLALLQQDEEAALRTLRQFVDQGYFLPPDFTNHYRLFAALRGQADFEAMQATMTERVNVQRSKLGLPPFEQGAGA